MGRSLDLKPTAVGVDGDFVYISDLLHSDIKVLDRNTGEMLDSIGRDAADYRDQLSVPANLTVDEQGFIHVTNIGTGRIVTLDRDGHVVRAFGRMGTNFANFGRPKGIAVDHQGQTYIVDAAHQNVQIFNDEGRLLMYFGGADALAGSMNLPAGIAVTRDNLDYYQTLASPDFELESVLLVTNHFGDNRLGVYGIGKLRGVDYEKEYQAVRKELEEMARKEKERRAAEQKSE
jgi:DNA-binding beta-propeller fold protein YncE